MPLHLAIFKMHILLQIYKDISFQLINLKLIRCQITIRNLGLTIQGQKETS